MSIVMQKWVFLVAAALAAAVVAQRHTARASTELICADLYMVWHDPESGEVLRSDPYVCGADLCGGYRCKEGNEISPACYSAAECPSACAGECIYIPTAQLDCENLCSSTGCSLLMTWYKNRTLLRAEPYDCELDACAGYRCLVGNEISPACYDARQCARSCKNGTCVDIGSLQEGDCNADLCSID